MFDWESVKLFRDALHIFKNAFKVLQKDNSSLGEAAGVLFLLNSRLLSHAATNVYANSLRNCLLERFPTFTQNMAVCSFFVPKFKKLNHCSDELKEAAITEIKDSFVTIEPTLAPPTEMIGLFSDDVEIVDEIDAYLKDEDKTMNAFSYWQFHEKKYPELARLARIALLPLASSAPSERIFSEAKNIEMRKRFHMVEDTLSAYVLIRSGFRSGQMTFELQ